VSKLLDNEVFDWNKKQDDNMIVNINPDPVCNKFDVTKSWEE